MHCNLHLQLSQCTRIANLNTELAGFCRSRFMHSHFHCGQLKEIAKRRSSGMQFELKCHMPLLTWLYYLTSNFQIRRVCKRRGLPTILIPCTFPVLTLNGSLFSFSVTQVTTVNILYISYKLKLYRIYKKALSFIYTSLNSIKGLQSHSRQ